MGTLEGKTFVVTGANSGIGRVAAQHFAAEGAHVFLACRSEERTAPVIAAIKQETGNQSVEFLELDLGSLASVNACADRLLARETPIHCLVNNAGVAGLRGLTSEGFEMHFGTNHLGHFLFTLRLLERLKESAPARIVNVSSRSHYEVLTRIKFEAQRKTTRSPLGLREYAVSKLCNVLFTRSLIKRLEGSGVTAYALDPGTVATEIWQRKLWKPIANFIKLFMIDASDGAKTTIHCATSEEAGAETGLYYLKSSPTKPSRWARDDQLAEELWQQSLEWVGEAGRAGLARAEP